jgi:TRAP-type C4-dicarboxylate transport system permease small subunit
VGEDVLTWLERIDAALARVEGWAVTTLVTAMVVLAVAQIALRNAFSSSIPAADTLLRHAVLWVGFLGAALAAHEDRHIRIDIGARLLPQPVRRWVAAFFHAVSATACLLLARAAWTFMMLDLEGEATVALGIPTWILQTILPAAFCLLAFHFLVKAGAGAWRDEAGKDYTR